MAAPIKIPPVPYNTQMWTAQGTLTNPWAAWFREIAAAVLANDVISFPITVSEGGTGAVNAAAAITILSGAQAAGHFLRSDGHNTTLAPIQAGDVPTLNQNTTGTAANITATTNSTLTTLPNLSLPASQVTGSIAAATAIAPATGTPHGAVTLDSSGNFESVAPGSAGNYLRSNGTDYVQSAIHASDVPTLNQNTSGSSASCTGNAATASSATTAATATAPVSGSAHGAVTLDGSGNFESVAPGSVGNYLRSNGTDFVASTIQASDLPAIQSGSKNYLSTIVTSNGSNTVTPNFDFGTTTGWTLGTTSLSGGFPTGAPTFGSGYSSHLEMAAQNTTILAGSYSLKVDTAASGGGAWVAGNFLASSACFIDTEDQAKVLAFKFYYQVGGGTVSMGGNSANTWAVLIYDVTNSAWIVPAGIYSMIQGSGVGIAQGTFQTPSNMTQFRLVLCCVNASTGTTTLYLDDFFCGPQALAFGPAMTDWVAYPPTITGFGTASSVSAYSRRIGDSLEVMGAFISGTPTAVQARVTLGHNGANANVTIDSNKINSGEIVGKYSQTGVGTTYFGGAIIAAGGNNYFTIGNQTSTASEQTSQNGNALVGAGVTVEFYGTVPIVGWSSNTSMSSDTDTRVIAMAAYSQTPTGTLSNSANVVKFGTVSRDETGGYSTSTGLYTVSVTGWYDVSATLDINRASIAVGNATGVYIYKNGTSGTLVTSNFTKAGSTSVLNYLVTATGSVFCNSGDTIGAYSFADPTTPAYETALGGSSFSLNRLSGPAVVTATESVNARIGGTATSVTSGTPTVVFTTTTFDSHNAYLSGTYTFPVSGKFRFSVLLRSPSTAFTAGNLMEIYYSYNGGSNVVLDRATADTGATFQMAVSGTDSVNATAGATLVIKCFSSTVLTPDTAVLALERIGN